MVSSRLLQFQSRNRGSFGFKADTITVGNLLQLAIRFQSRNREFFCFQVSLGRHM